jgi:hypothetical protein
METIKYKPLTMSEEYFLEKPLIANTKRFFYVHFEEVIVGVVIALTVLTHFLVVNKLMFLDIYFLPTLLASYILGRRSGVSVAVFSVALVVYFVVMAPETYLRGGDYINLIFDLVLWGGFLILTSIVVGSLYEQNREKNMELKNTYEGVLELLAKFIDSADKYTQGHSQRVTELATEMAIGMNLSDREIETVRVVALLHDIGKVDISTDVILKAAKLSEDEISELKTHVERGGGFLRPFQQLFKDAVAIILAHHRYYDNSGYGQEGVTLNSQNTRILGILTIADAYDAMISDRPYRAGKTPREALAEIKGLAGKQFDPVLVDVFMDVMKDKLERT